MSSLATRPIGLNTRPRYATASPKLHTRACASSRTDALRVLLEGPNILKAPCCFDGLSARLIEEAGFEVSFMSGFCVSAARLASPDAGLISYAEMLDTGRLIHESTTTLPIIGDGDTGYGNAMNVKRTVRGYAAAGLAGILIEDQEWPKRCGHMGVRQVVPRHEAVARVRAAADARDEGADILILARTDARQAVSLEEALWRAAAFADAGADILFIDALTSVDDMTAFTSAGGSAATKPKMANMLEGGQGPFSAEHAGVNQRDVVEADAILPGPQPFPKQDSAGRRSSSGSRPPVQPDSTSWQDPAFRRCRVLRFKVTDSRTQSVKLETTFPAGFLDNIPAFIPAIAGIDLDKLVKSARPDQLGGQSIADFTNDGDRVQIFLQ
ncbi:hypothetical protein WJX84_004509 [Apatococcus fuscideae]|uniref:Isocitrate lyase n=1 Tax=Apatococcus fuscideae TaxID=2026836 RepID=A0AAW1SWN7_9CHLO